MKFVRFDDDRLGLLTRSGDGVIDLTGRLGLSSRDPLIEYLRGDHDASEYVDDDPEHGLQDVRLSSPVARPGKIVAWPGNYAEHREEMGNVDPSHEQAYFLKAPSSVTGPNDVVELPYTDRRFDHEVELAFVIGEDGKDIAADEAMAHVFGFTMALDISMRGDRGRSNRKSFDTFTPVGPAVVTPDELGDPADRRMTLAVNGETRQDASTARMVFRCEEIVQYASIASTLHAGDLVMTGTPAGVGQLRDGDEIRAAIDGIGEMALRVVERDESFGDRVLPPR